MKRKLKQLKQIASDRGLTADEIRAYGLLTRKDTVQIIQSKKPMTKNNLEQIFTNIQNIQIGGTDWVNGLKPQHKEEFYCKGYNAGDAFFLAIDDYLTTLKLSLEEKKAIEQEFTFIHFLDPNDPRFHPWTNSFASIL